MSKKASKKASKKEQRAFMFDVRAAQDDRGNYIEGRPVVYGKEADIGGMFREEIVPGALDKTDLHDVCFLTNHDLNRIPLARSRNNNKTSTLQLTVDKEGLKIRAYLDTENNADARALYSAIERGDITGMSFMFWIEEERMEMSEIATGGFVLNNPGTVPSGALFHVSITAPTESLTIYTDSGFLGIKEHLQAFDNVYIRTTTKEKAIWLERGGTVTNLLPKRISGMTWAQVEPGTNHYRVEVDIPTGYIMDVTYRVLYEGV